MLCRENLGWNDTLSEKYLKEWRLISNDVKSRHKIVKLVVDMVILKVLLKLSCMVSQAVVYQVTVAAYISDIVKIIIVFPQSRIAHDMTRGPPFKSGFPSNSGLQASPLSPPF